MASLAEKLRRQLMPPPPPKRPQPHAALENPAPNPPANGTGPGPGPGPEEEEVEEEELDEEPVREPPAKRARLNDQDQVTVTSIENEGLFTPLRTMYSDRVREDMANLLEAAAGRPISCLFCECGEPNLESDSSVGTWAVGYNLMVNYIRNNWAIRAEVPVCNEVVRIYNRHIYDPCVAACGGVAPPNLVRLTPGDVLTHVRDHTRHPIVTQMLLMDTLKQLIVGLSARTFVNGVPDVKVAAALVTAIGKLDTMNDRCRTMFDKETDLVLDPLRVNAIANMHRLESLKSRSSDALGGATATGSSASSAASAVLEVRPNFGHPAFQEPTQSVDESDADGAGDW